MRTKSTNQKYINFCAKSTLQVVNEYREKYESIEKLLEDTPELISRIHQDLATILSRSKSGRKSQYTSEQILRSFIVMFLEGKDFRKTVIEIENSEFLRGFVGLGIKSMMDYTFLNRAFNAVSDTTWQILNSILAQHAQQQQKISPEKVRLDSTVYETNIHYPTDSSLLWDSFRKMADILRKIQQQLPHLPLKHRFHVKKVKKLHLFITRNGSSNKNSTKRRVKSTYRTLIARVNWIAGVARDALRALEAAGYEAEILAHYIPIVERILNQADQRVLKGAKVSADEKVYSLFEEHTELIKRGKAGKPIEFGHKVLIAQTGEKFIHHYDVFAKRREDKELIEPTLAAHKRLFGTGPGTLAADKGFYENMEQILELEENIKTVSICKKGRRNQDEYQRESTEDFKDGQRFRAGCEGSISVLKRVFKLDRCLFKGFKNYAASVGCAVFCHNLVLLTRL